MTRGLFFPGCGAQYVGMGKEVYDAHRIAQDYFEEAAGCIPINFLKLTFAASDADIMSYDKGPLALLVIELATVGLLRHTEIPFEVAAGGDMVSWYAAVHAARAVTLPDALYIVHKWIEMLSAVIARDGAHRALVVDGSKPSTDAMLTTLADQGRERGFMVKLASITPRQIIVVGDAEGLLFIEEALRNESIAYEHHDNYDGFAALLPDEDATQLQVYLEKIDFHDPVCPVISPCTGDSLTTAEELRAVARELCTKPARVDRVMRALQAYPEIICSIPAGKVYTELQDYVPQSTWLKMDTEAEFKALTELATGIEQTTITTDQ